MFMCTITSWVGLYDLHVHYIFRCATYFQTWRTTLDLLILYWHHRVTSHKIKDGSKIKTKNYNLEVVLLYVLPLLITLSQ
jgi:hypothetical protein